MIRTLSRLAAALAALLAAVSPAVAAEDLPGCPGLIAGRDAPTRWASLIEERTGHGPSLVPAVLGSRETPLPRVAALRSGEVGLTFVGHATFLIETAGGVTVATDYNDYVRPDRVPVVATMNRAHSTHYTNRPDPGIAHVLRGWNPAGGPARHDLRVGDARVRNVVTNIRDWRGGTDLNGNSIFVVEAAELCIAHLGHLHHTLEAGHLKELGRIDVVLVPVDGSYTLDTAGMVEVLQALHAPLMIPMHYFNPSTLERFLEAVRVHYPVERSERASITLSRETLPKRPTVLVLPGR